MPARYSNPHTHKQATHFDQQPQPGEVLQGKVENRDDPTHQDREAMEKIVKLARLLDDAFRIPGTNFRVGIDGILGLIPGIGDASSAVLAAVMIVSARRLGASRWTIARMVANTTLDVTVGAIPLIGDAWDFFFKSNRRNLRLLERELAKKAARESHGSAGPGRFSAMLEQMRAWFGRRQPSA